MSHVATAWAYRQHLDSGPKFVLIALADFADENGTCYPGQERLARMTGMHRSTVVRHIQALEDMGLISRFRRGLPSGRGRTSDRYLLHLTTNVADYNVADSNVATNNVVNGNDQSRNLQRPMSQDATGTVREPSVNRKEGARKRGTRIPSNFRPSSKAWEDVITDCPDVDLDKQTKQFIDHFAAQPGQKGVKLDWDATWRNWMRRQQEWADERKAKATGGRPVKNVGVDQWLA